MGLFLRMHDRYRATSNHKQPIMCNSSKLIIVIYDPTIEMRDKDCSYVRVGSNVASETS